MTIEINSSTDKPEAVTAALGDLAEGKPTDEKVAEETPTETKPEGEKPEGEVETVETSENEDEAESEESEEVSEDENQEKPKKKGGFQKRIDKLNKKLSDATQEKEHWRQEALRAKTPEQVSKPADPAINPDLSNKPKADSFESHEAYVEALTEWKLDQKLSARDQQQKVEAAKNDFQTQVNKHRERVDEFSKSKDDWDEVTEIFSKAPISMTVQDAIVSSEHGPEMLYELGKNQEELMRICKLTPTKAAMELGKIEARFSKPSEPPQKKTTKAPPPVNPVRAKGSVVSKSLDDPNISQREFERLREQQIKQRGY